MMIAICIYLFMMICTALAYRQLDPYENWGSWLLAGILWWLQIPVAIIYQICRRR